jgi:hypothetical protein
MSRAPWSNTAAGKPHGFRVTIERARHGSREIHTFPAKTPARHAAVQAAGYKQGFLRLIDVTPLTREEWLREFPNTLAKSPMQPAR